MTEDQERKLNEIYAAIVGNEKMGHKGIIHRLKDVEKYQEKDRRFKNWLAGVVAVITPVLVIVWAWVQKRFL